MPRRGRRPPGGEKGPGRWERKGHTLLPARLQYPAFSDRTRVFLVSATILVHGLWYGPISMALVRSRLQRAGFDCRRFSYPTLRASMGASAGALRRFVGRAGQDGAVGPVHLVGHSLGGLIILRMLADYPDCPAGRVVLLGSPVQGSVVSRRVGRRGPLRPFLGSSRSSLEKGYPHCPRGREVGVIAGTAGMGIGLAFGGLSKPHDGTVGVKETRLAGATDTLQLPVSHTGLVTSPRVVEAVVAFLETGRFDRVRLS